MWDPLSIIKLIRFGFLNANVIFAIFISPSFSTYGSAFNLHFSSCSIIALKVNKSTYKSTWFGAASPAGKVSCVFFSAMKFFHILFDIFSSTVNLLAVRVAKLQSLLSICEVFFRYMIVIEKTIQATIPKNSTIYAYRLFVKISLCG